MKRKLQTTILNVCFSMISLHAMSCSSEVTFSKFPDTKVEESDLSQNIQNKKTANPTQAEAVTANNAGGYKDFRDNYGVNVSTSQFCPQIPGDHNGDGVVTGRDFLAIQRGEPATPRNCNNCYGSATKGKLLVKDINGQKKYVLDHIYGEELSAVNPGFTPVFACNGLPYTFANNYHDQFFDVAVSPVLLKFSPTAKLYDVNLNEYQSSIDGLNNMSVVVKGEYSFDKLRSDAYQITVEELRVINHGKGTCFSESTGLLTTKGGCTDMTTGLDWYHFPETEFSSVGVIRDGKQVNCTTSPSGVTSYSSNLDAKGRPVGTIFSDPLPHKSMSKKKCDDLNAIASRGKTNWRLPTNAEISSLISRNPNVIHSFYEMQAGLNYSNNPKNFVNSNFDGYLPGSPKSSKTYILWTSKNINDPNNGEIFEFANKKFLDVTPAICEVKARCGCAQGCVGVVEGVCKYSDAMFETAKSIGFKGAVYPNSFDVLRQFYHLCVSG